MNEIVFTLNGKKRPGFGRLRYLLLFNKIPIIRDFKIIKRILCALYDIPLSTTFNKNFYVSAPLLNLGNNVGLADTFILAYAPVTIGDNCSFSFRNMLITSTHDFADFSTIIAKSIMIGDNVWITSNVTILPGCSIGENTVIGAGSVVTSDIPANVFAAGNPCKVIKKINFKK
jgi:maltose O-acetyltransferase